MSGTSLLNIRLLDVLFEMTDYIVSPVRVEQPSIQRYLTVSSLYAHA